MANEITKDDLISWIKQAIKEEDYIEHEITLVGTTGKGEGYMGDIVFANVNGITKGEKRKEVNLVIKHGKCNVQMRNLLPMRLAFETEINFYTKIIPAFKKLQQEHEIRDIFETVPKCYYGTILSNMEVLIFENLNKLGFELHDRKLHLNFDHQRKVLENYGKFHAMSFALRDQKPEVFSEVFSAVPDIGKQVFKQETLRDSFQNSVDEAIQILEDNKEYLLVEKFRKLVYKNAGEILYDFLNADTVETALTHGDCWNNNYMFKYEGADRKSPSNVMILDWQFCGLYSPALDLSHFIYAASSKEELDRFDELIEIYYTSFSTFLRQLGSNPEKLFSYYTLKNHWNKYKLFGLIYLPIKLKFILCEESELPDLTDIDDEINIESFTKKMVISDKNLYYERLKAALNHFFEFEF